MRRSKLVIQKQISILAVDDDPIITDTIKDYFTRSGYHVDTENNPQVAVNRIREGKYDILMLDFLMAPICGDQVVEEIRQFNRDLFIILLTGHKSMAPPVKTIRQLDIQGYYEKDDRFDQLELLVESCVKSIKQMRTLREYEQDLSTVVENLPDIYHLQDCGSIADDILTTAAKVIPFRSAFVHISDIVAPLWRYSGERHPDYVYQDLISDLNWTNSNAAQKDNWYLFRLVDNRQAQIGIVGLLAENDPSREKLQLLSILSKQASAALSNFCLHNHVHEQNLKLDEAYMQTIETLRFVVETRDKETRGHSERVSSLAVALAQTMALSPEEVEVIRLAGLFHDIGKIGVPDSILLKNGPLTDDEFLEIKKHPAVGESILVEYAPLKAALPVIRSHHERYNGFGYPDRLAGEEICLGARIIAVADSFDAMISNRTYRSGLGYEHTAQELLKGKGTQFDPQIVDAFFKMVDHMGKDTFELKYCSHVKQG